MRKRMKQVVSLMLVVAMLCSIILPAPAFTQEIGSQGALMELQTSPGDPADGSSLPPAADDNDGSQLSAPNEPKDEVQINSIFGQAENLAEESVISRDALRVSEEYAAAHPAGVLEFATVQLETGEGAADFNVIIARRGGTTGKVSIDVKAIDISAKYGQDYTLINEGRTLEKEADTPSLMEAAVEEQKGNVITAEPPAETTAASDTESQTVAEPDEEMTPAEPGTEREALSETEESSEQDETNSQQIITADESMTETTKTSSTLPEIETITPVMTATGKSSLQTMRDEVLGINSEHTIHNLSSQSVFDIQDPDQNQVTDAVNTILPGASSTLIFEDGENYKVFKIHVIDDDVYEAPEQFVLGLFEPTGGAELGNALQAKVNIEDNDEVIAQDISLEHDSYMVNPQEGKVDINIIRSGGINDYAKFEISTLSGTAKADVDYRPVMTEALFMPGETMKTVQIPLLNAESKESVSFELLISQDEKPVSGISRAVITIDSAAEPMLSKPDNSRLKAMVVSDEANAAPGKKVAAAAEGSSSLQAMSAESYWWDSRGLLNYANRIVIKPWDFMADTNWAKNSCWWSGQNTAPFVDGDAYRILCDQGWDRLNSGKVPDVDLRGTSSMTITWANDGDNDPSNWGRFYIGSQSYTATHQGYTTDWAGPGSGFGSYLRCKGQNIRVEGETKYSKKADIRVWEVVLYKQQFGIEVRSADNLSYNTYIGTTPGTPVSYNPGTVEFDNSNPYRDQTVTLIPRYTDEANKRGTRLVGYQIYDNLWGKWSDTIYSTQITFTPDFIDRNIYWAHGGGSYWNERLIIKPVFTRQDAGNFYIQAYDENTGLLKIGGIKYNNQSLTIPGMKQGDLLQVDLVIQKGYIAKGISTQVEGSTSYSKKYTTLPCMVEAEGLLKMTPQFERSNNTVLITWKGPDSGNVEDEATNKQRGLILHDRPNDMPQAEYNVLFAGVTSSMSDADRMAKIEQNYPAYRSQFSSFTICHAAIGDIITLYAKPQPGYTVLWRNTGTSLTDDTMVGNMFHVGSSFSFPVSGRQQEITYYFVNKNTTNKYVYSGRVIRSKNTIKKQSALAVDPRDTNTYQGAAGIYVAAATADSSELYCDKVVDGKTVRYSTSAMTDKDGYFSIYLPNGVSDQAYSLKLSSESRQYAKSVLISCPNMLLQIPFMDDLQVTDMNITGVPNESSTLEITNRQATLAISTRAAVGREVLGAIFRSYDDAGSLWQTGRAIFNSGNGRFEWTCNVKESFKNGGRITVELIDESGEGHGEIESGYTLYVPPTAGNVAMPSIGGFGEANLDIIGNVNPSTGLGTARSLVPQSNGSGGNTYFIACNSGETIKQAIIDGGDDLDSKTLQEKCNLIMSYIQNGSVNEAWSKSTESEQKTGKGKGSISIGFNLGFYLQLTRQATGNDIKYYYDYCFIHIAGGAEASQEFNASICGVPVYLTLSGGGALDGLIASQGGNNTAPLILSNGYFPSSDMTGITWAGNIHANVHVGVGAGLGRRQAFSVGVTGNLGLDLYYQPWSDGKGNITFGLSVDIDILVIPLSFKVYENTWPLFKTPGYQESSVQSMMKMAAMQVQNEGRSYVGELERADQMSCWLPASYKLRSAAGEAVAAVTLQSGIYKHPQAQLIALDGSKMLMVFLNDDLNRDDYDRTAVYYSIYDGSTWSAPVQLQNDGTLDNEPAVSDVGNGKVLVSWSSANHTFGDVKPALKDMLNSMDIYAQFFDKSTGTPSGTISQLTNDQGVYANSQPRVAFDTNSDKVMVMYTKTDYNTPDVSFDQSDVTKIGDFLYNSYSLIAYRIYVDGNWQTTYYDDETQYLRYEENNGTGSLNGQRFISFTLPGVADSPKITETAVTSYNGLTLYAYTLDVDQNPLTKDDTEIFMMIYNYAERSISYPIRITDNLTPDENPQIARYGDTSYLYWNNDGRIAYLNISGIVKYGLSQTSTDGKYYYVIDEAYKQPVYATTAKNYDAASSYQVTVGQDGNMYLVWSEYKQYAPDTDHPSERISERQLYAAMYDAKYKEAAEPDSDGNIVYTGAWGDKYQLTRTSGEYNNEQAIAVDGNGQIVVVNRRYTIVNDEINGGTKESDTSSLIARAFVPASSLEIGDADISIYPEFPRAGESVSITATAHNQGFKPSDQVTFKFSLINEENETSIGENIVQDVHLVAGGTTTAYANLNLPEEMSNAKIKVMAWEGDMENSAVSREIAINSGEKLSIENEYAHMIHRNKLLVTGRLLNLGNQDASGVTLVLEKTDPRATVQALMVDGSDMPKPLVLKEITYDRLAAGAAVEINETVDIPDENYNEAEPFELTIKARQKIDAVDTTVAAKHLNIEKPQTEDTTVQGISILGAQDETPSITITAGTSKNLNARLIPLAAANAHTMLYQSSNPDIASVDQSGLITGLTAGTAVISIMSIKSEPAYLSGLDDKIYTADGTAVQFDNTGRVQNQSSSTVNSDCDYTQTVTIQVTGQSSGSGPSSHIPTVVQPVTQPGTAVDNDGATVQVKAVISLTGSLTLATVNPESISAALDELKQATGTQNRVLNIQIDSAAGTDNQINLPKESVAAMAESGVQVQITSSTASVRLDSMTMRFINEAADGDVTLQVNRVPPETLSPGARKTLGDRPAIDIAMKSGDKVITGFGGSSLIVTIPYEIRDGEDVNAIVVYYLDDSGTLTMVKASNYDSQSKTVTFATQHLSKYAVAYHRIPFDDTVGHWAEDAIDYLVSREVVSGTGDNRFVPDQDVTRAEFVKMLLESLDGIDPGEADQASFDDVEPGAWYAPSINWGSSREIIAGYSDGRFGPNDRVSREQMAVILVSLAKAGKQELKQVNTEQSFADSDQISTWAKAAVTTVQTAGIINGKPGKLFDPQGNTTRAEAATVIADMMKKHLQ